MAEHARDMTLVDKDGWRRPWTTSSNRPDRRSADAGGQAWLGADGQAPESLRGPAGLQQLMAALAVHFVSVDADAIDDAVANALRQAAEVLGLDGASLWRSDNGGSAAAQEWTREARPAIHESWQPASIPFVAAGLGANEVIHFGRLDELPSIDRDAFERQGIRSAAALPVATSGGLGGARAALVLWSTSGDYDWTPAIVEGCRLFAGVIGQALSRQLQAQALQRALDEIHQLRISTIGDDTGRPSVRSARTSGLIVSESGAVQRALAQAEQVATAPATVLLLGETGVGKEVFAQAIHELSPRHQRQMVRVSCAAIPSALIESELFGRERGAYTGALTRQIGRFEAANQSTLFLDEIGELSAEVQVKLLRVLQERVIERLGSTQSIKVDVRIIAATNRNLEKAVEDKMFREDLFYRINVFPIVVPPLRERVEDIPGLVWQFVDEFSKSLGKPIESISKDSLRQLQQYQWPGNVRELRNVIERAMILATSPRLTVTMPQTPTARMPASSMTLKDMEIEHIRATLERTNWRIRGLGGAAERLGLKPTTLEGRIARLGMTRPRQV
jgi:transcriptional regulator with GAF, ATPase, and Fis domain